MSDTDRSTWVRANPALAAQAERLIGRYTAELEDRTNEHAAAAHAEAVAQSAWERHRDTFLVRYAAGPQADKRSSAEYRLALAKEAPAAPDEDGVIQSGHDLYHTWLIQRAAAESAKSALRAKMAQLSAQQSILAMMRQSGL